MLHGLDFQQKLKICLGLQQNGLNPTGNDARPSRVPKPGVWCPAVPSFNPATDQLVLQVQAKYYSYLSKSGLTGLAILGTNAETLLLTREERVALLATSKCCRLRLSP
jgi:hypothetical protein